MDSCGPIQMDILLSNWEKVCSAFADFPGALNEEYILQQLKRRNVNISTVTHLNEKGTCPLLEFIRSPNCSYRVLRLIFLNGVDVKANSNAGHSFLVTALHHHARNRPLIKAIVSSGADVDTLRFYRNCALCVALINKASPAIIKMLLRAGALPNCGEYTPALFQATKYSDRKTRGEVLKLLIDNGGSLETVGNEGRSVLCYALLRASSRLDVDLLIKLGLPTDTCNVHGSPIVCALDGLQGGELLVEIADCLLGPFEDPMQGHDYLYALPRGVTNPQVFDFRRPCWLDELENVDDFGRRDGEYGTLLHAVTYNAQCTYELVELLVHRGVPVGKQSSSGRTPAHVVLKWGENIHSVLQCLLHYGCPLESVDHYGRTVLVEAILREKDSSVLNVLLMAGARVTREEGSEVTSALETAVEYYSDRSMRERVKKQIKFEYPYIPGIDPNWRFLQEGLPELARKQTEAKWDCLIILFLYAFLEDPDLDFKRLCKGLMATPEIDNFAHKCLRELRLLQQKQVGNGYTLFDFISRRRAQKVVPDDSLCQNFDQLLKILAETKGIRWCYFDMVLNRVPRDVMENKLPELRIFTVVKRPHLQVFILNYQCVSEIAKHLSNNNLMKLILAFYDCVMPTAPELSAIGEAKN